METSSSKSKQDTFLQFQDSNAKYPWNKQPFDAMAVQRVQLPRDAQGSLEVFNPQEFREKFATSGKGMQSADNPIINEGSDYLKTSKNFENVEEEPNGDACVSKSIILESWREEHGMLGSNTKIKKFESTVSEDSFCMPEVTEANENICVDENVPLYENFTHQVFEKELHTVVESEKQSANGFAMKTFTKDLSIADRAPTGGLLSDRVGLSRVLEIGTQKTWTGAISTTHSQPAPGISVRNSVDSRFEASASCTTRISKEVKDALSTSQQTFVVADATRPEYPVLYASAGFFKMTGYTAKEVIGRNCRFLQGAQTDYQDVAMIRDALAAGKKFCGRLLNYKKDGSPFWNLLTIAPIKDGNGKVIKFIGMQVEVSKYTEGTKEKALRPNGLPESLIKYDARQKDRALSLVSELVQVVRRPRCATNSSHESRAEGLERRLELLHALPRNRYFGSENMNPITRLQRSSQLSFRRWSETGMTSRREAASPGVRGRRRSLRFLSLLKPYRKSATYTNEAEPEVLPFKEDEWPEAIDIQDRREEVRMGIDLATTLERIEKSFVITDPRLPDNPIIFASDSFLELTEYNREEVLGRNCRLLQGLDTDPATVKVIRDAIKEQRETTVQLLNYTKSGKSFWNLFHLQPMRDKKGDLQYFIGVQLDGSEYLEPFLKQLPDNYQKENVEGVRTTAANVDIAVRELPDANLNPDDLWIQHSRAVYPKPHKIYSNSWKAMRKVCNGNQKLELNLFRPIKFLGHGDTGRVHLVELQGTGEFYAMKVMNKLRLQNRNKVHRVCTEREILEMVDHPFLPTLYGSFQTRTHICFITDFCAGGELHLLLDKQPFRQFKEETVRFYAAELVVALEYLHCMGIVYRDLKPENVLIQRDGHISLVDFNLSLLTSTIPKMIPPKQPSNRHKKKKGSPLPKLVTNPIARSNSFVGTEEYIAPEIITGSGHNSAIDWWALGILVYEMLYGRTPFLDKSRNGTFSNILKKEVTFPRNIPVSIVAKQFIHALLQKDPTERLGSLAGADDIKKHPFFSSIMWPLVRCMVCCSRLIRLLLDLA
ncbi:hypothetical protein O6H91_03G089500 [Diphasiastrum complanatum]|uniref:Uncharacterized protein n=3 Tax=Diphasiastrum complanatum TaxID=34168 RepID=A0ACC2E987_DIPCM|nr:hypothetical protein O6H91_03G089500 [Diphasiastrum complanatum]KAJ7562940.1 hypothetical protein O6H91_03G089500 [Diphasiastrum complanatum]KAJ7562943.1 hypothetical protein O6H91_03G089500 [Diphasiastrum complanatum]